MALITATKVFGVNDLKVAKLLTDVSGSSPTYATSSDAGGVTSLKLSPKFDDKEMRGDEQVLDKYTKLQTVDWSFDNMLLSLDILSMMLGQTITAAGTTPNQTQTLDVTSSNRPPYFKLEGQSTYTDAGDVHFVLWKCKANKVDYELKGGDYATVSASGTAIPLASNQKLLTTVINETAVAIS